MITPKFDLYQGEWLDLVFDNRNKAYGAYQLRKHYSETLTRAMLLTFGSIACVIAFFTLYHPKPAEQIIETRRDIVLHQFKEIKPPVEAKKPEVLKPVQPVKPAAPAPMIQHLQFEVKPDNLAKTEPATVDQLSKNDIGPVTTPGTGTVSGPPVTTDGGSTGTTPAVDPNTILRGAEVMPEPVGGMAAWNKFMQKNLRYPDGSEAQGRVIVSFVVERDGSLSNIQVVKSVSPELDAEAVRVLKKAPLWKPGMQNGQPVRVAYTIPFNFMRPDGD